MPTLNKLLSKFDKKERVFLEFLIEKIVSLKWYGLDIKKLKGYRDIFRLRKRKIRIIFTKDKKGISIITIEYRKEDTYKL